MHTLHRPYLLCSFELKLHNGFMVAGPSHANCQVMLKFLNHIFSIFGEMNWLTFIPKAQDRISPGDDLGKVTLPEIDSLPILKLVPWWSVERALVLNSIG